MQQLTIPPLAEGERYIGSIGNAAGEAYHLILLPGDNDDADHATQQAWAESIGGDLPDRVEQAMLYATAKDAFKEDWYWSNQTHAAASGYAWFQYFYYGNQDGLHKSAQLRARAVRRLVIE